MMSSVDLCYWEINNLREGILFGKINANQEVNNPYNLFCQKRHCSSVIDAALRAIGVELNYWLLPNRQFEAAKESVDNHNSERVGVQEDEEVD